MVALTDWAIALQACCQQATPISLPAAPPLDVSRPLLDMICTECPGIAGMSLMLWEMNSHVRGGLVAMGSTAGAFPPFTVRGPRNAILSEALYLPRVTWVERLHFRPVHRRRTPDSYMRIILGSDQDLVFQCLLHIRTFRALISRMSST